MVGLILTSGSASIFGKCISSAYLKEFFPKDVSHVLWNQTFGGYYHDEGSSIVEVSDGSFAIAGRTEGFGLLPNPDEVWLVNCDQNGQHLWNKTYGGGMKHGGEMSPFHHSVTIVTTGDGGFLITSHTTHYGGSDADAWLIRTDEMGNHLWNHTYGGTNDELFVESVVCSDGGFLSVGLIENTTVGFIDGWIVRTDANGNHLWNRTYGNPGVGEIFHDIIEVSEGGFALVGWIGGFEYLGDTRSNYWDYWLLRIDANGNHLWNQTYGGAKVDGSMQLVECQEGGFAICGGTESFGAGSLDLWLVRTDANGQQLWNQTYGGDDIEMAYDFVECKNGGFAIFTLTYTDAEGTSDAWFVRTDSNGNRLWDKKYGGSKFDQAYAGIEASADGFVMVEKTKTFGAGNCDMWVLRIPDAAPTSPSTSPPEFPLLIPMIIGVAIVVVIGIVIVILRRR